MEKKKFERVNKEVVKRFAKSPFYHTPYQIYYESMKENQKEKERKEREERGEKEPELDISLGGFLSFVWEITKGLYDVISGKYDDDHHLVDVNNPKSPFYVNTGPKFIGFNTE